MSLQSDRLFPICLQSALLYCCNLGSLVLGVIDPGGHYGNSQRTAIYLFLNCRIYDIIKSISGFKLDFWVYRFDISKWSLLPHNSIYKVIERNFGTFSNLRLSGIKNF
jgi:hypothetical protein